MITNTLAGAAPAPVTLSPTAAQDLAALLSSERPRLRVEYALSRPGGGWWRDLSKVCADPMGTDPSVYHSLGAALAALADVAAVDMFVFGSPAATDRPVVMRRPVCQGITTVVGPWRPVPEVTR